MSAPSLLLPLPPIRRPNGRLYYPRKIVTYAWEDSEGDAGSGVIVFGTHDVERARPSAVAAIRHWYEQERAVDPRQVWLRDGYLYKGERSWVHDVVRGRAGVSFAASDEPEPTS